MYIEVCWYNARYHPIPDHVLYTIHKYNIIYRHINSLVTNDLMMKYSSKVYICLLLLLETYKTLSLVYI